MKRSMDELASKNRALRMENKNKEEGTNKKLDELTSENKALKLKVAGQTDKPPVCICLERVG